MLIIGSRLLVTRETFEWKRPIVANNLHLEDIGFKDQEAFFRYRDNTSMRSCPSCCRRRARSSGHKLMVFQPPGDSCEAHKYQDPFLVWMTKVAEETVHVQLVLRLPK